MESLYFLIPISLLVVVGGVWLFFWAVNNGQYDDLDGEAERILFEQGGGDIKPAGAFQKEHKAEVASQNVSQDD
ncbi:MAG: cbb3-type cytochrome oxidase assembly protein CcoS [Porticoccaceae bacterium]|nr:cbb3-type cytochrome oxidase assembly protein CcoS [Porticoccaceae bacterium]